MQNSQTKISGPCGRAVSVYEPDKGDKNDKMKVELSYAFTDKMKSEIKLPGMNTQALEQLGKIFEENVQEVAEGYFSLNPKTKKQRRG